MATVNEALDLQEQIARIGRELADAEHKRMQALDIPKGATARTLTAGAALFAAGGAFVGVLLKLFHFA
jgi:hypothetical protein